MCRFVRFVVTAFVFASALVLSSGAAWATTHVALYAQNEPAQRAAKVLAQALGTLPDLHLELDPALVLALKGCKEDLACVAKHGKEVQLDEVLVIWARDAESGGLAVDITRVNVITGQSQPVTSQVWPAQQLDQSALLTAKHIYEPAPASVANGGIAIDDCEPGDTVVVDGNSLGPAASFAGVALPAKDGVAVVIKSVKGELQTAVSVHANQIAHLHVDWAAQKLVTASSSDLPATGWPSTGAAARPECQTQTNTGSEMAPLRLASYITGGAGVVALGVGAVAGIVNQGAVSDYNKLADQHGTDAQNLANKVRSSGQIANASFIIGGVAVAAGVVLYFLSPDSAETFASSSDQPKVSLGVTRDGGFVSLEGRF